MPFPPLIQIVGYKNSGKTTLAVRLVQELKMRGYRIGTVKHDAHEFELDRAGTDTWQHYEAGADAVSIASASKAALLWRTREASLEQLVSMMPSVDAIIAEGFKDAPYAKIALIRSEADLELLQRVSGVFAVGCWGEAAALPGLMSGLTALLPPGSIAADLNNPSPLIQAALERLVLLGAVPSAGGGQ